MSYIPFPHGNGGSIYNPPGHLGIDFSAPIGTGVPAAVGGTVIWSGQMGTPGTPSDFGNTVVLLHTRPDGSTYTTWYTHLNGEDMPQRDSWIEAGAKVGEVGNTGNSEGPHLHYEINEGNDLSSNRTPIDPNTFDYGGQGPFNWYVNWISHKLDGGPLDPLLKLLEIDPWAGTCFTASQRTPRRGDPLTLDLDGDGIETVALNPNTPVMFDTDGDGVKIATGWIHSDDGLLVLDRNANGVIDSGRELFGDSTLLSNGEAAADGFAALSDQDTNSDGRVDSTDTNFANLRIWRDLNQNGISEAGELTTLAANNIASINTSSLRHIQTLSNGNQIADLGTYTKTDGTNATAGMVSNLADVNLAEDTFIRTFDPLPVISPEAQALPNMQGSGLVRDLREAATQSSVRKLPQ